MSVVIPAIALAIAMGAVSPGPSFRWWPARLFAISRQTRWRWPWAWASGAIGLWCWRCSAGCWCLPPRAPAVSADEGAWRGPTCATWATASGGMPQTPRRRRASAERGEDGCTGVPSRSVLPPRSKQSQDGGGLHHRKLMSLFPDATWQSACRCRCWSSSSRLAGITAWWRWSVGGGVCWPATWPPVVDRAGG